MTEPKLTLPRKHPFKSTGPKTARGKAASSQNAIKHGVLSIAPVLPRAERRAEWEEHRADVVNSLEPVGYFEKLLAVRIALISWRLWRVVRYEVKVATASAAMAKEYLEDQESNIGMSSFSLFGPPIPTDDLEAEQRCKQREQQCIQRQQHGRERQQRWKLRLGRLIHGRMLLDPEVLDKVGRYESGLERSLFRNLHELQRLQAARSGVAVTPPAAMDVDLTIHH